MTNEAQRVRHTVRFYFQNYQKPRYMYLVVYHWLKENYFFIAEIHINIPIRDAHTNFRTPRATTKSHAKPSKTTNFRFCEYMCILFQY